MIRLRVLGSAELTDSRGVELTAILAQPKRFALLVHLAVSPGFQQRDTLLALFWPELTTRRARGSLNQAIGFLRKELGGEPESVIVSRGVAELGIDSTALWCDAVSFDEHVRAQRFGEALDLYRGELLPGFHGVPQIEFEEWLAAARAQLQSAAVRAARKAAQISEHARHYTTAVASARRAVDLSELDERAVRDLLSLLDRLGDRAGALSAYDEFSRRLAAELDAEPSAETRALVQRIQARTEVPAESVVPGRLAPGVELNGCRVIRELGRGGMATVYLALEMKHDRHVAIKELRSELATRVTADLFLREIQIMARLAHPHILPLIDSGARQGLPYLVTPYVAGESLRTRLNRDQRIPVEEALRLTMEIAQALDYAHRRGVIHCDIKPENILLADGHAVVADFGIAAALFVSETELSHELGERPVIGSPPYMSPESQRGALVGVQTDIYALGCVLVEMLSGALPSGGELPGGFPRFGTALSHLAAECVAVDPGRRPRAAADLVRRLDQIAHPASDGEAAKTEAERKSGVKWRYRRNYAWITLAALGLITLPLIIRGGQTTPPSSRAPVRLSEPRQITFSGRVENSAISDDGKTVAYVVEDCTSKCMYAIEENDITSRIPHRVVDSLENIEFLRWSPDRRTLMFRGVVNGNTGLFLVPALGGAPKRVGDSGIGAEFFGADSLVIADGRWIAISRLDGVAAARIAVADSTEHLRGIDVMKVPASPWFIVFLLPFDTAGHFRPKYAIGQYRMVDRQGHRVEGPRFELYQAEWASRDALWRLANISGDRHALIRYPFDRKTAKLAAIGDTVYEGPQRLFDVTRDGSLVTLTEGSTNYETWELELTDALAGRFTPSHRLLAGTMLSGGVLSPDGARVFSVERVNGRISRVSVGGFDGKGERHELRLPPSVGAMLPVDARTVGYVRSVAAKFQFGLIDAETSAIRDTLTIADTAILGVARVPPDAWLWWSGDSVCFQRSRDTRPRLFAVPKELAAVADIVPLVGGRGFAMSGPSRAFNDSSLVLVLDSLGGAANVWLTASGFGHMIVADRPTGFLTEEESQWSVIRIDGPGRSHPLGVIPRSVYSATASSDLRRLVITTQDFHGDAWTRRVIRP